MNNNYEFSIKRSTLVMLAAGFSAVMIILAWLVKEVLLGETFFIMFKHGYSAWYQVPAGLFYGTASGGVSLFLLLKAPFILEVRRLFQGIVSGVKLNVPLIIFISLSAGISEEIFFRGTIQPLTGVLLASFIFILMHGYFNLFNRQLTLYGILMFLLSIGLGLLYKWVGLVSAITAHAVVDVLLLWGLKIYNDRQCTSSDR